LLQKKQLQKKPLARFLGNGINGAILHTKLHADSNKNVAKIRSTQELVSMRDMQLLGMERFFGSSFAALMVANNK
jgi:hypothetical protein